MESMERNERKLKYTKGNSHFPDVLASCDVLKALYCITAFSCAGGMLGLFVEHCSGFRTLQHWLEEPMHDLCHNKAVSICFNMERAAVLQTLVNVVITPDYKR